MKLAFRVECPHCKWGFKISSRFINVGFLKATCDHCKKEFFFKISVNEVKVEVSATEPVGLPIMTIKK